MELYFPIILDGATGTQLQKYGYQGECAAEQWVLEHPEIMLQIQRKYIESGSNIIYAPTFSANRIKLEESGIYNKVEEYNVRLVQLAKQAAEDKAYVAGDLSPLGKFLVPIGDMHFEEMVDVYRQQVQGLERGGVDLYVVETMTSISEARAAVLAIRQFSDKPIFVSFTVNEDGKTINGNDILAVAEIMQSMDIQGFGLNCSVGPKEMHKQLLRLGQYAKVPLLCKPNAGMPVTLMGKTVYKCSPESFVENIDDLVNAGVKIFGGCCGTDEKHIHALKESLRDYQIEKARFIDNSSLVLANEHGRKEYGESVCIDAAYLADETLEDKLQEDESQLIAIKIDNQKQLDYFETCQGNITAGLCIQTESPQLLEKALRIYQGKALYQGNISADFLKIMNRKYGLQY